MPNDLPALQPVRLAVSKNGVDVLVGSGVLSRCNVQHDPLVAAFNSLNYGVIAVEYPNGHFSANEYIDCVKGVIEEAILSKTRIVLWGTSLGGTLFAIALTQLRRRYRVAILNECVKTILVDAPSGWAGPVLAPGVPAWVNPIVGTILKCYRPSRRADAGYGKKLLEAFRVPPKPGAIIVPSREQQLAWLGHAYDEDQQYRQFVMNTAIDGLSGHSWRRFIDQDRYMFGQKRLVPLYWLDGLDVTYVACMRNNVTIHQPDELRRWAPHVRAVELVPTAHCAYLEAQPFYNELIRRLLAVR